MKILKAIGAAVLAVATCFSARAEVVTNDLVNAAGTVIGYEITGLGTAGDEVALVFTDTSEEGHTWQVPAGVTSFEYLVVAGGGGGGSGSYGDQQAGGGGAGGYLSGNATDIASGSLVKILVGPGGAAKTSGTASSLLFGETEIKAIGGGRGGSKAAGTSGGSGGGGGHTKAGGSGTEGQGYAGGKAGSNGNGGGGGGAGGAGVSAAVSVGGDGGPGLQNDITGTAVWYAAGGGGSSRANGSGPKSGVGGLGGGGSGGASPNKAGGNATSWGSGGGGGCSNTGGSGYQGVVVIRYTAVENLVLVPEIESKAYNGERQYSGLVETDDYTVVDEGGVDGGRHPVVLTLKDSSKQWDMEDSVNPLTLYFEITKVENSWTAAPSITIPEWIKGADEIGSITPATTLFGDVTVTITKDGQPFEGDYTDLSTFEAGSYVVTFTAPADCSSYTAITDEPTRTVEFIVYAVDEVPEYTLTLGNMTVNADRSVSVPYTLACEVATEYTANIYAAYAIEGSDTTNTCTLAEGVALTCSGTGSIPDLKPGVNYSVSFYAMVEDEQSEPTTPVIIAIPGAASDLTASATFTNDPMKFIVSGSVVPGIGTTTVAVNWAINDTETLNNTTNFVFQYGDEGTFSFEIPYTSLTDKLTYNVTVQNTVEASTHGDDFTWNSALDATTKSRADAANITYTWTGAGDDNLWTNIENWHTTVTENFGYPNSKYARASFTSAPINGVNLDGKTITLRTGGNGLAFSENLGEVVFTNGKFAFASGEDNDYGFGASGTTVVFDSVNITSGMRGLKFKSNSPTVFSGDSDQNWAYEPWGIDNTRLIVRNGTMSSGYFQVWYDEDHEHDVVVSNAVWTIRDSNGAHRLGMMAYFRDGDDYQGRVISKCDNGYYLQHSYDIEIPESGHEYATVTAVKAASKSPYCNIKLDVSDYKSAKLVPLVRYTSSTDQALSTDNITLVAYTNGVDGAVDVTADRNATLVWSSEDNTLYYEQDGEGVAMIGEEIYETLQDAVDAAVDGNTITLIDDVALETTLAVWKSITLDMGGNAVTAEFDYSATTPAAFWVKNGGNLTLKNGTLSTTVEGIRLGVKQATDAETKGTATIESTATITTSDIGVMLYGGSTLNSSGTITSSSTGFAAIQGNGLDTLESTITITGGFVSSTSNHAIYHPQPGTLTVSGGEISGVTGIEMRAGTLNMEDGTVAATGTYAKPGANNSGSTVNGAAIVLSQHSTGKNVTATITGGAITAGDNGKTFVVANTTGADPVSVTAEIDADVTFDASEAVVLIDTLMLTGDASNGYSLGATVASIGNKKYATIAAAYEAALADETITLLADATLPTTVVVEKSITLDMGGKTVTAGFTWSASTPAAFWVKNGGNLTLKNGTLSTTVEGIRLGVKQATADETKGTATIASDAVITTSDIGVMLYGGSTLTSSGTITSSSTGFAAIQGNGLDTLESTINITGGSVASESNHAIYHPQPGTLTITGGTISGVTGIEMRAGTLVMSAGSVAATDTYAEPGANNSGSTVNGAAIVLSQHSTGKNVTATITGGAITAGDNGKTFVVANTTGADPVNVTATIAAAVTFDATKAVVLIDTLKLDGNETDGYTLVAAAGKWDAVIADGVTGVTADNKANVETKLDALAAALGAADGAEASTVTDYFAKAYGTGVTVTADALLGANAETLAVSVAYDLPLMAELPDVTVAKATADGALAFEFRLENVTIATTATKAVELVKYSATVNGTYAYDDDKMTVTVVDGKLKAVFNGTDAQGFAKVDFTVPTSN